MGLRVGRLPARFFQIKMNFYCLCSPECQRTPTCFEAHWEDKIVWVPPLTTTDVRSELYTRWPRLDQLPLYFASDCNFQRHTVWCTAEFDHLWEDIKIRSSISTSWQVFLTVWWQKIRQRKVLTNANGCFLLHFLGAFSTWNSYHLSRLRINGLCLKCLQIVI